MGTDVVTAQKIVQIHQKNLGMGQTPPPLDGAKIAAVVLHTMNIEGQIHQKNPGMGQTPPLSGNARILEAPVIATPPLVPNESNNDENSSYSMQ